jgi:DNA-binding CsgD family transcriptional regulator
MDEVLAILEQTADGVCAMDHAQHIVFWNAAAEHLLGYAADEVLGRACYEIFRTQSRPGCFECHTGCVVIRATGCRQLVPTFNLLTQTKARDTILLNVSSIVLADCNRPYVTIHLFRDASYQLQYETYVEQLLLNATRLPKSLPIPVQNPDELAPCVPLSAREKQVLHLLAQARAACDIADNLCISVATVRNHIQTILRKLGVHSQREAVKLAQEHHLV